MTLNQGAAPRQQELGAGGDEPAPGAENIVEGRFGRPVEVTDAEMVLEPPADRVIGAHDRYAVLRQQRARPDARKLKELRRIDRAGRQNDLRPGVGDLASPPRRNATPTARLPAKHDPLDEQFGDQRQVGAPQRGTKKGVRRRAAQPLSGIDRIGGDAFRLRPVQVVDHGKAEFPRGGIEMELERMIFALAIADP